MKKQMTNQMMEAEAVIRSLRAALEKPDDPAGSLKRVRGMISRLPEERLYIIHNLERVAFYEKRSAGTGISYLRKDSDRLYLLARSRYLRELLQVIERFAARPPALSERPSALADRERRFEKLAGTIRDLEKGNLDLARIVLTPGQYGWLTGDYRKKKKLTSESDGALRTKQGFVVETKSEQNIGNAFWRFAVPVHYEERIRINVQPLVNALAEDLSKDGRLKGNLFYLRGGTCFWNVPQELSFMNSYGSLWRTYDFRSGCIAIHPDYSIMLTDGAKKYWEHEGLLEQPGYRVKAMERIAVMRISGGIDPLDLIETTERDSNDPERLDEIIRTRILPRLWF